jgi:hypothetical protein
MQNASVCCERWVNPLLNEAVQAPSNRLGDATQALSVYENRTSQCHRYRSQTVCGEVWLTIPNRLISGVCRVTSQYIAAVISKVMKILALFLLLCAFFTDVICI